jgi:hypothetical protein
MGASYDWTCHNRKHALAIYRWVTTSDENQPPLFNRPNNLKISDLNK